MSRDYDSARRPSPPPYPPPLPRCGNCIPSIDEFHLLDREAIIRKAPIGCGPEARAPRYAESAIAYDQKLKTPNGSSSVHLPVVTRVGEYQERLWAFHRRGSDRCRE